jgi:hypothetical protein
LKENEKSVESVIQDLIKKNEDVDRSGGNSLVLSEITVDDKLHQTSGEKNKDREATNTHLPKRRNFEEVRSLVLFHKCYKTVHFFMHFGTKHVFR